MCRRLLVLVVLVLSVSPVGAQIRALPSPVDEAGAHFGSAVSLRGDFALVGASGVDACGENSGSAFVFARSGTGAFEKVGTLADGQCRPGGFFGREVVMGDDVAVVAAGGETVRPGQPNTVHVFHRSGSGLWEEEEVLLPPEGSAGVFGSSLALSGDLLLVAGGGDTARGAYHGEVHVYQRFEDAEWRLQQTLRTETSVEDGVFGSHVATDGRTIVVTASPFGRNTTGSVHTFERGENGQWQPGAHITGFRAGTLRADVDRNLLAVGESQGGPDQIGRVVVFGRRSTGSWLRQSTLTADVPYANGAFGSLVVLSWSDAGPRILAVGYSEQLGRETNIDRVVHVFGYDALRGWSQRQILDVGDWAFAMSVDIDASTALVGRAADHLPGTAYAIELVE